MKATKYLASFAVIIFGLSSLGIAQEGYYGQQASPPATAESQTVSPCLLAQLHGTGADATVTQMPPVLLGCSEAEIGADEDGKGEGHRRSNNPQEGDPAAPQNQVEYGGGGM